MTESPRTMQTHPSLALISSVALATFLCACGGKQSQANDASSTEDSQTESAPLAGPSSNQESAFVEGVAGGVMVQTLEVEAEVVSVDQKAREAVVRGPKGNEITLRVGEEAVNFYQVEVGDRVQVAFARELVVYVDEDGSSDSSTDGTTLAAAGAEKGERPGGVVVGTSKLTATIESMDLGARTATLAFETGEVATFDVRPDVEMENYEVGQKVVFLVTEMMALEVNKL